MLHERLRDGDESFGLTQGQYASREKARLRDREKKRRLRARQAADRTLVTLLPSRIGVATFVTASGLKAFTEPTPRIIIRGMNHRTIETRVSLPFVSVQHGN